MGVDEKDIPVESLETLKKKALASFDTRAFIGGAAGSRTLVQTNPPYAFYMLI